jgi:hypothetical protein
MFAEQLDCKLPVGRPDKGKPAASQQTNNAGTTKRPVRGQQPPVRATTDRPSQAPVDVAKGKKKSSQGVQKMLNVPKMSRKKRRMEKNRSLMQPAAWVDLHPFAETLHKWEKGVPVDCGDDWTRETLELAIAKGPHASAMTPEARKLVLEDVAYQVDAGFSRIITWDSIKNNPPSRMKISPLAVVPQVNRRGRLILDLSFPVHRAGAKGSRKLGPIIQESVNDTTVPLAPLAPVNELGKVLLRLLHFMRQVPDGESINFSKIDLSDGFWRMIVPEEDCWHFAYVLPDAPGEPTRLVIPHALQMGWTQSPGFFSAVTETVRDIIQVLVEGNESMPPHTMETSMVPEQPAKRQRTSDTTWQMSSVFVDDFILAAVENEEGTLLMRTARAALHSIHGVFPPPSTSGHKGGKDPVSEKKLEKGDARWATKKEILGFLLDGRKRTIQLTNAKADAIVLEITRVLRKQKIPLKRFQKLLGKLQHAAGILPAAKSLFTPLNVSLRDDPKWIPIPVGSDVRYAMLDFKTLIRNLAARPTHVMELEFDRDDFVGYCDASAFGAGGVWFSGLLSLTPTVWRVEWPSDITANVVSDKNPDGTITNSDLEMAGVLIQQLVLERLVDLRHRRSIIHCDNTPSVSWVTRMSARGQSPTIAHRLLRGLAMRQRTTHSACPAVVSIPGVDNTLADVASRIIPEIQEPVAKLGTFNPALPPNQKFLTYFAARFPLPQPSSWQIATPAPELLSNVILTLRGRRLQMQRWTLLPDLVAGEHGRAMHSCAESILSSEMSTTPSSKKLYWPLPPKFELDPTGMVGKLEHRASKKPCVTWHKPKFWRDTPTLDVDMGPKT